MTIPDASTILGIIVIIMFGYTAIKVWNILSGKY